MTNYPEYSAILSFSFDPENAELRFAKNDDFDRTIHEKFYSTWQRGRSGELWEWRESLHGRLAEIIVLDQFSRNLHRGSYLSFAQDGMALALSQELYAHPAFSQLLSSEEQRFAVMPFMHSESQVIHTQALKIFTDLGHEISLQYEIRHKEIIDRFGRYPHRNEALGRKSTSAELSFLQEPNSSF